MAHSFVQARENELESFRAFARDHPDNTVLLVDTYDTLEGVRNAVVVADEMRARGEQLRGIRLDSGDLGALAREARRLLDDGGHTEAQIFASGGVDEHMIHDLVSSGAPIDAFGVGTSLTVSKDQPAFDIVYKLVEYDGHPRAKYSEGKVLLPGAKQIFRRGAPDSDVLGLRDESVEGDPLLRPVWRDGDQLVEFDLEEARTRAEGELSRLPEEWRRPDGPARLPLAEVSPGLRELADKLREREVP
jgi:nicotinate phosphoribosyltransferase